MFSLISLCSRPRSWILLATPLLILLFFRPLPRLDTDVHAPQLVDTLTAIVNSHHEPPVHDVYGAFRCPQLPGMEDALVVLKTGVTEALEKIPVQIRTSLQCVSHYVIFSDYEEQIAGVQTYDVLRTIKDEIRLQNPDFEIYNRVQRSGRDGLNSTDFPIAVNGAFGQTNNPGWELDKWKFLPMVDRALQIRPDAKWYVFMEADTYLIWPNLAAWLARLDSTKPQYIGNPVQINDIIFAHGGSGIVLSSPAMHLVSDHYSSYGEEINNFTTEQWAGDLVLGKVLADVGVTLSWSWPMLHGGMPWDFDYFGDAFHKRIWCYPAISYHHANATEVEQLWQFSQEWFQNENRLLLHSDVFRDFILPQIMAPRDDWDNMSFQKRASEEDQRPFVKSIAECESRCRDDGGCKQFSFEHGKCAMSNSIKRGVRGQGIRSGWMIDRTIGLVDHYGPCRKPNWLP